MATKKATTTKKPSTSKKTVSTKTTTVSAAAAKTSHPSFAESIRQLSFWRSLSAELVGTFILAAVFIVGQGQPLYLLFAVAGLILLLGTVSGAYLNPATTIASWVSRRISWVRAVGYIVFQIIGALLAFVVLSAFVGGTDASNAAIYGPTEIFKASALVENKEIFVFFSELLGTFIFGFAFANALRASQERLTSAFTAGIGIFVALMISFIAASYVTGTAILNPAVAFSLQGISFDVWPIAVYILAPIVGAILGFFLNDFLKGQAK